MADRPNHPPIVYVEWSDAAHLGGGWQDRREVIEKAAIYYKPTPAVGFLVQDGPEYLVMAATYNPANDDVGHAFQIPRSEVKRLVFLRPARGMERSDG